MRILHVIGSLAPRYGGPSATLPQLGAALARRGHHVEVITTNLDGNDVLEVPVAEPLVSDGITVTYFATQRPRSYATSFPMALVLSKRIAEFDVVHVHSLYLFHTLAACALCRRRAVPYIIRPHGTLDPYHRAVRRWRKGIYGLLVENRNIAGAAAMHYTSASEHVFAREAGIRTAGYVIPHGVELSFFDNGRDETLTPVLPRSDGRILVTFLGRLTEKKGLDLLCEAFTRVSQLEPRAHLVIAGPDNEGLGTQIRRWISETGLRDRVSMPGIVAGSRKAALLRETSVFVLVSKDENFGVTVAEALAAKTAVIVAPGVAIHEQIAQADAGLVIERTAEALADALIRLLGDEPLRRRLAANGRALVEELYSWDRIGEQIEQMYAAVIGRSRVEPHTSRR